MWFLSILTGDQDGVSRQWKIIRARVEAEQFYPAEFIVLRVVFEALVQAYVPADAEPGAVNAIAREALAVFPTPVEIFDTPGGADLITTAAVIRRAMGDRPQPRYAGLGEDIQWYWLIISVVLVRRYRPRPARLRKLTLDGEHTADTWHPRVVLTPAG